MKKALKVSALSIIAVALLTGCGETSTEFSEGERVKIETPHGVVYESSYTSPIDGSKMICTKIDWFSGQGSCRVADQ